MFHGTKSIAVHLTWALSFGWVSTQLPEPEPAPAPTPPVVVVVPNSQGQGALVPVQTGEGSTQAPPRNQPRPTAPAARKPSRSLVGSELKGRLRVEGKNPKVYELRETRSGENVITEW